MSSYSSQDDPYLQHTCFDSPAAPAPTVASPRNNRCDLPLCLRLHSSTRATTRTQFYTKHTDVLLNLVGVMHASSFSYRRASAAPSPPRGARTKVSKIITRASTRDKILGTTLVVCVILLAMKLLITDHDVLFLIAEFVHFVGIGFLAFKLLKHGNCVGVSLKSQQLTAAFLAVRLYCSFMMEYDWHTLLDALTLGVTMWVCRMMLTTVRGSYNASLDATPLPAVVAPCVALAVLAHPTTKHAWIHRVLWAVCVYLEAVSVLPQLRMMQKARVVERFTANYVFALGVARFFSCAHWILQVFDGKSYLKTALGTGLWPLMVLTSELVQTGILADFCYYFVLSMAQGEVNVTLPV